MKTVSVLLRFARLSALLLIIPNIRSCDDASGMAQTSGFPLPYARHVNGGFSFLHMDWGMLAVDVLFFALLALVLLNRAPDWLARLSSLRVFLVMAVYGLFNLLFGWVVFFALLLPALGLNELVPIDLGVFMDIGSRILLAGLVLMAMAVLTRAESPVPEGTAG